MFTAGIGENAKQIRERVCRDASWLGSNWAPRRTRSRLAPNQRDELHRVGVGVIPTDEELMIARHMRRVLSEGREP